MIKKVREILSKCLEIISRCELDPFLKLDAISSQFTPLIDTFQVEAARRPDQMVQKAIEYICKRAEDLIEKIPIKSVEPRNAEEYFMISSLRRHSRVAESQKLDFYQREFMTHPNPHTLQNLVRHRNIFAQSGGFPHYAAFILKTDKRLHQCHQSLLDELEKGFALNKLYNHNMKVSIAQVLKTFSRWAFEFGFEIKADDHRGIDVFLKDHSLLIASIDLDLSHVFLQARTFTLNSRWSRPSIKGEAYMYPKNLARVYIQSYCKGNLQGLSLEEAQSIAHELGHALHIIASESRFHFVSGVRHLPKDFAEIPALVMEELLFKDLGLNFQPNANDYKLAWLDLKMHSTGDVSGSLDEQGRVFGRALQGAHRFKHLGPYGGSYYIYPLFRKLSKEHARDQQRRLLLNSQMRLANLGEIKNFIE